MQSTHCLIARDCDDVLAANGFHFEHTCDTFIAKPTNMDDRSH